MIQPPPTQLPTSVVDCFFFDHSRNARSAVIVPTRKHHRAFTLSTHPNKIESCMPDETLAPSPSAQLSSMWARQRNIKIKFVFYRFQSSTNCPAGDCSCKKETARSVAKKKETRQSLLCQRLLVRPAPCVRGASLGSRPSLFVLPDATATVIDILLPGLLDRLVLIEVPFVRSSEWMRSTPYELLRALT